MDSTGLLPDGAQAPSTRSFAKKTGLEQEERDAVARVLKQVALPPEVESAGVEKSDKSGFSSDDYDFMYKVTLVGESGVGKSTLLQILAYQMMSTDMKPTIGVEFATVNYKISMPGYRERIVKLQIWDTAGQERYRAITSAYYRGTAAIVYLYDITRSNTLERLKTHWYEESQQHAKAGQTEGDAKPPVGMVIGNKSDLRHARDVTEEEGAMFANDKKLLFMEASGKYNDNVLAAFEILVRTLCAQHIMQFKTSNATTTKKDVVSGRPITTPTTELKIVQPPASHQTRPAAKKSFWSCW